MHRTQWGAGCPPGPPPQEWTPLPTICALRLVCSDARQRAAKGLTVDRKLLESRKRECAAELDAGDPRCQVCHGLALGHHTRLPGEGF